MRQVLTALLLLAPGAALAQQQMNPTPDLLPQEKPFYMPAGKLLAAPVELHKGGGLSTYHLSDHEFYYVEQVTRTKTQGSESHAHWADYMMVQKGDATLVMGGKMADARETRPRRTQGGRHRRRPEDRAPCRGLHDDPLGHAASVPHRPRRFLPLSFAQGDQMKTLLLASAFALAATAAFAQVRNTAPDGFKYLGAADIAAQLNKPANGPRADRQLHLGP